MRTYCSEVDFTIVRFILLHRHSNDPAWLQLGVYDQKATVDGRVVGSNGCLYPTRSSGVRRSHPHTKNLTTLLLILNVKVTIC